jgi:hypothetical protein
MEWLRGWRETMQGDHSVFNNVSHDQAWCSGRRQAQPLCNISDNWSESCGWWFYALTVWRVDSTFPIGVKKKSHLVYLGCSSKSKQKWNAMEEYTNNSYEHLTYSKMQTTSWPKYLWTARNSSNPPLADQGDRLVWRYDIKSCAQKQWLTPTQLCHRS